ncbi:MAG: SurA N-terminal domain-containing protein [Luminiphilus sp.]|jgi:peptidyl-prolyl cis-trans isomerase D|nr:SurA N-terminal domain-containing protein [Luminiphilus sp.]
MLQSMRQSTQGTTAKIIIGLIVLSFAAFGLETLLPGGSGSSVADVNGEEITPFALQEAVTQQKRQLVSILGDNVDPAMLDDDRLRPRAIESLIQRMLLLQQASALNLSASDGQIGASITSNEVFQLNGVFSTDAYKSVLANAGYTPERFKRAQAEDIVLTQLQSGLRESEFSTATEISAATNLLAEERDVRYIAIASDELVNDGDLSPAALRQYYEQNEAAFFYPEQLVSDFILLSPEDFPVDIEREAVEEQFEVVKEEYAVAEQARVSHILLMPGNDEAESAFANRISNVSDRLSRGEDFSALAAELSDDLGSAGLGGELGFTDGTAFPEEMESAIAALTEVGQISPAVQTEAGTHFIRLDERILAESIDTEAILNEVEASMKATASERELLLAVEELRDLVFNAADLDAPAKQINAMVQQSEPFSIESGRGIFGEQRLRDIAFSDDVLEQSNNSEIVELSDKRFVVLRVRDRRPPQAAPFSDVEAKIKERLRADKEATSLATMQDRVEAVLVSGGTLESAAADLKLEWRVELASTRLSSQLPRPVLEAAFAMPAGQPQALRVVAIPGEGYALVQLARVSAGDVNALGSRETQAITARRLSEQQELSFAEYLLHHRNTADIVVR